MKKRQMLLGFTLIELMISIVIVGILVGIAYPSYVATVRKTNRVDAKTELMDVAQRLQRCYTAYSRFDDPNCAVYKQMTEEPGVISRGPGYYKITIATQGTPATAYTLTAAVVTGTMQAQDTECEKFTLSSTGVKAPADKCW